MSEVEIELTINGKNRVVSVEPNETLLNVLRERFYLTGVKYGCGIGECGACTVLMEGKPVLSCQLLAVTCDGKKIVTVEGLSRGKEDHPMQQAFIDEGAVQCGFCTPGMVLSSVALAEENISEENIGEENTQLSNHDIKEALRGNLCRCTGYENIFNAVKTGTRIMKQQKVEKFSRKDKPGK
ncbi:MAG: (2Fe-2S)-binding protein [Spirochaetaceae bacterium]